MALKVCGPTNNLQMIWSICLGKIFIVCGCNKILLELYLQPHDSDTVMVASQTKQVNQRVTGWWNYYLWGRLGTAEYWVLPTAGGSYASLLTHIHNFHFHGWSQSIFSFFEVLRIKSIVSGFCMYWCAVLFLSCLSLASSN